jgi:hypothetical protein
VPASSRAPAALRRYLSDELDRACCALARIEVLRAVRHHGAAALELTAVVPYDRRMAAAAANDLISARHFPTVTP